MEHKLLRLSDVKIKAADTGGLFVFEGYACKFGGIDTYRDTIIQGAFAGAIRAWQAGGKVHMYYNHSYDDWLGNRPQRIGKWLDMYEDDVGLYVKGELTPNHSLASDVGASLRHGTVDGLSIGYAVAPGGSTYDSSQDVRILTELYLYEVSVVDEPADRDARITAPSLKAALAETKSLADIERALRDAGGFSRSAATAIVAQVKQAALRDAGDRADDQQVDVMLSRLNAVKLPTGLS